VLIALAVLINCRVENIKKINNLPQKIVNIECSKKAKESFVTNKIFESHLTKIKNEYEDYRIVVRPSGTENKLRIMVEGESLDIVENIIEQIHNKIVKLL
jgi:phosphoglucosamine mutase